MRFILFFLIAGLFLSAVEATALTLEQAIQSALKNHQRIAQSAAGADLAETAVVSARSDFLPGLDLSYSYINRDQDPFLTGSETSILALTGTLNLFNGMKTTHRYKAARHRSQAAKYQLQATKADIILATKQAYIETLRAEKSIETAQEGVDLLARQHRDAQLQFDFGLIARNDLLRIDVELSSARQQLLTAQGQLKISRHRLERTIGRRLNGEQLIESNLNSSVWQENDVDNYQNELLNNRSELSYLRQLLQANERDRSASKGTYLPSVDLSLSHEEYGDSLTPGDLPNTVSNDDKLMLSARWNLFDGFSSRSAIAADEARIRATMAELRNTEEELLLQLSIAMQNTLIARGKLREARTGVAQAEENYRVTKNRFQQQQATTVDLLDAQFLLTRARNLEISARYDLDLAAAILERILERDTL